MQHGLALADYQLHVCFRLQLNVSGNGFGPEGAKALAPALVRTSLTAVALAYNGLKDEGVAAICEAIQSNKETKLASLDISSNGVGTEGAKSVAAMVAATGSLTSVSCRT